MTHSEDPEKLLQAKFKAAIRIMMPNAIEQLRRLHQGQPLDPSCPFDRSPLIRVLDSWRAVIPEDEEAA